MKRDEQRAIEKLQQVQTKMLKTCAGSKIEMEKKLVEITSQLFQA